jgi:hypothetical protein
MSNKFVSVLEAIGHDFEVVLTDAVKYLPLAEQMAKYLFPPAVAPLQVSIDVADLLQNTVALAEQKYAAAGKQSGTGAQKLATALTVAQAAVTTMLSDATVTKELAAAGITVNADYISNLVNAVVAILNVQAIPAAASTAQAAA